MPADTPVYGGLTQAQLDAQYDQATAVPGMRDYMARWAEAGAAARTRLAPATHAYGPGPAAQLDLYLPPAPRSAHLHLHGGAWRALSRQDAAFTVDGLSAGGAAVAVADFPLAPAAPLGEIVAHVRAAFLWLRGWAAERGLPVTVSGHSSGGHLAACLLDRGWWQETGVTATDFAGVLLASGIYDLEPVRLSARNRYLHLDAAEARRLSPLANLPEALPPMAILWGDGELDEFRRQSRAYAEAVRPLAPRLLGGEIAGLNHFEIYDAFALAGSPVCRALAELATD